MSLLTKKISIEEKQWGRHRQLKISLSAFFLILSVFCIDFSPTGWSKERGGIDGNISANWVFCLVTEGGTLLISSMLKEDYALYPWAKPLESITSLLSHIFFKCLYHFPGIHIVYLANTTMCYQFYLFIFFNEFGLKMLN